MKTIIITYTGRSGSYLLGNLLDGHTELLTVPPYALIDADIVYHELFYRFRAWPRIIKYVPKAKALRLSRIAVETVVLATINEFPLLFAVDESNQDKYKYHVDDSILKITSPGVSSRSDFMKNQLNFFEKEKISYLTSINFELFLHSIFHAYDATKNQIRHNKKAVVWQKHNPYSREQNHVETAFQQAFHLKTIREPLSSIDSHLWHHKEIAIQNSRDYLVGLIFSRFRDSIESKKFENEYCIKFEDMHISTEKLMKRIAELIGIKYEQKLTITTIDNEPAYFKSKDGEIISGTNKDLKKSFMPKAFSPKSISQCQPILENFYSVYNYTNPRILGDSQQPLISDLNNLNDSTRNTLNWIKNYPPERYTKLLKPID